MSRPPTTVADAWQAYADDVLPIDATEADVTPVIDGTVAAFKKDHPDAPGFDFDAENGGTGTGDDDADSKGGTTDEAERPKRGRKAKATPETVLADAVAGGATH